jgi:hypothetical protein
MPFMMRRFAPGLLVAVLFLGGAALAHAQQTGTGLELLSGTTMSREGALVVGLVRRPGAEHHMPHALTMTWGPRSILLEAHPIAPGLVRFQPAHRLRTGPHHLSNGLVESEIVVAGVPRPEAPVTPALREARRRRLPTPSRPRGELAAALPDVPDHEVTVTFDGPPPEGTVAVLVYWGQHSIEPAAWAKCSAGQTEVVVWNDADARYLAGRTPPPDEEGFVRIAFVDGVGQVGHPSAAVPLR